MNSKTPWHLVVRYAVAPVTVGLALACRLALNPVLGHASPFMYFFISILVSGWLGGLKAGLAATVLSDLAVTYFYMEPVGSFWLASHQEKIQVASFLILGSTVSLIVAMLRQTLERAERAQREAQDNGARYRAIYEHADIGLERLDAEGRLLEVNPTLCRMLGATREELLARSFDQLTHPDDRADERQLLDRLIRHETSSYKMEKRYLHQDGRVVWVRLTSSLAPAGAGFFRISVVEDITERVRTEEELRRSEEKYRAIIESATDYAIFTLDAQWKVTSWNSGAQHLLGYGGADILGQGMDLIFIEADRRQGAPEADMRDVLARGRTQNERWYRRKDGSRFWGVGIMVAQHDDQGRPIGFLKILQDITERKQAQEELERRVAERTAQLQELNDKLEISNRELQDFAFVASHDLQEPLRKVMAFGDCLASEYKEELGETGADYLRRMQSAARRMQALISDLLQFSRVTTKAQPFSVVNLGQVAGDVISDLEVRLQQSEGHVEVDDLAAIEADPLQMRQLLQNLIGNALKFARPDEAPRVRVYTEPATAAAATGENGDNQSLRLCVADNGIGFEEKYLDRIFTVFQRLHERGAYEGTGIGLAICRKIAERHGGSITARSRPGAGSTFIVTLPLRQAPRRNANGT